MKKKFLLLFLMMTISSSVSYMYADGDPDPLPLSITPVPGDDNIPIVGNPLPKSPVHIPEVYLDGHALSFDAAIEGCEVRLLDEYENVIFTDFIEENQTSLILPSTLTGIFELQIIRGNIILYCEIEL